MKKLIVSSVLLTSALLPGLAHAEETVVQNSLVTGKITEVRKGATSAYPLVTTIGASQQVSILDTYINSAKEVWYRVNTGKYTGWAKASNFPVINKSFTLGKPAVINGDVVNIRKGASITYDVVTKLTNGQKVSILDSIRNSKGELWYRIKAGESIGWTLSSLVTVLDGSTVTPIAEIKPAENLSGFPALGTSYSIPVTSLDVRRGADPSYAVVAKVSKGQTYKIIGQFLSKTGEKWIRIQVNSTLSGWIPLVAASQPVQNLTGFPVIGTSYTIPVTSQDVRRGADPSYAVVAKVSKGQTYKVIGQYLGKTGEKWIRIQVTSTLSGWIPVVSAPEPVQNLAGFPVIGTSYTIPVTSQDVRRGADLSYAVIAKVSKGQAYKVIGQYLGKTGEKWIRIQVTSTLSGWIPVASAPEPVQNLEGFPVIGTNYTIPVTSQDVRRGADLSYAVVAKVAKGQAYKVIGQYLGKTGEKWIRIQVSSAISGWIQVTTAEPAPAVTTLTVGTRNAVLYSGASFTGYRVVERIPYLSKVTVISRFTNSQGQNWVRVKTAAGNIGWTPEYELTQSVSNMKHVYAIQNAVVRRGAESTATAVKTLAENEVLLLLTEYNGWLNVETNAGIRGWVLKSQTSELSLKRLISPDTYTSNNDVYLRWQKPSSFEPAYSMPAANQLKIYGGLTDIILPSFPVRGIKSVQNVSISATEKAALITFEPGYSFTIRNYDKNITIKVVQAGLAGKRIVVDAGHGGKDPGAIGPNGLREKDVNLSAALILKAELEKAGAIVTLTRSTDVFLELSERTAIANSSNADAFISLHTNSYNEASRGSSSYFNTSVNFNGPQSKVMAADVQKNLVVSTGTYNRGIFEQDFYVNRMNELPSILVEMAFISNPTEEALLKSTSFQQKVAAGIRNGLVEYFTY